MLEEGMRFYAQAGITTAQDCASGKGSLKLLEAMEQQGKLPIDIIAWPVYKGVDDAEFAAIVADREKRGRLRRGGLKMTTDGSIQGYTAFLSKPYHVQPGSSHPTADKCVTDTAEHIFVSNETPSGSGDHSAQSGEAHRGYANMTQEEIDTWLRRCDEANVQTQVHTNGDAATDMLIKAVDKVRGGQPRPDLRTTIIHAQTMREDQLEFSAKHGLTPSFFPIHVYFWGDRHREIFLGPERAARINPSRTALDRGMKITLHHDAPVAGIEMLMVAWSAINRVTTGGKKLGLEHRITPFEALRAITADAAWQNFEEDRKGTLEAGKLADMVVLSDDPLAVDALKVKDIQVLKTIKEGESIYTARG
jgi:predicted amidohydrolase YtcJ